MSRHRQPHVRPRYGRMATAATSVTVTAIAVLGGAGALPSAAQESSRPGAVSAASQPVSQPSSQPGTEPDDPGTTPPARRAPQAVTPGAPGSAAATGSTGSQRSETALPPGSGEGRRVVYSESRQRVWLVQEDGEVLRTYLVSGSVYDNLDPGTYSVFSRSEQAWGIDDSGAMKYFVRFTQGDNAAIGFHDIPVDDGRPVQGLDQLGTPQSHGCIRQRRADAVALWEFAPLGTTVVVTA